MHGRMLIYKANFDAELDIPVSQEYDTEIPLDDLQAGVGGSIEAVPYWDSFEIDGQTYRAVVWCNEEGKLEGLPRNTCMTGMWDKVLAEKNMSRFRDGAELDYLVGSIVVTLGDDEFMDNL
jgi:hypothetical protein